MIKTDDFEKVEITTIDELSTWLENNHNRSVSVWLIKWKKDAGHSFIGYDEIVD